MPSQHINRPLCHHPYRPSVVAEILQAAVPAGSTCPAAGLAGHTAPAAAHIGLAVDRIDLEAARTGPVAGRGWEMSRSEGLGCCSTAGRCQALGLRRSGLEAGIAGTWAVRLGARPVRSQCMDVKVWRSMVLRMRCAKGERTYF
jgi:hypothetical protein